MTVTAEDAAWILKMGLILWVFALTAVVLYRVLVKNGAFRDMMYGETGTLDPERVGTFAIIFIVAGYYILQALNSGLVHVEADDSYWMPDIPESLLIVLAGGKSAFLAGKITRGLNRSSS